ncbi:MAG: nitrilase family protein [Flavobacteriales bacterium]|nr:MAG: nitrilase family protein [Flavobacteriales bacterium]
MNLKVTAIQSELHWENVDENLRMFSEKIAAISETTDVIVLPEMFNTGFSMLSKKLAETMDGKTVAWMKDIAQKTNAVIVGSLIVEDVPLMGGVRDAFYNRLIWAQPDGVIYTYDKRHLFRMANEHEHFKAGNKRLIIEYKGWKICPLVCYDLRFPVWSRNTELLVDSDELAGSTKPTTNNQQQTSNAYDLLIYIANWPGARKAPWSKLLEARAIENQCYVVGVNRVGEDGKGFAYTGNSAIINSKGEPISNIPENENCTETVSLSLDDLNSFRKAFPVGMDADGFTL